MPGHVKVYITEPQTASDYLRQILIANGITVPAPDYAANEDNRLTYLIGLWLDNIGGGGSSGTRDVWYVPLTKVATNDYTGTTTGLTAYGSNAVYFFVLNTIPDGSAAIRVNLNSLGYVTIKKPNGIANMPVAGLNQPLVPYEFAYNGTSFVPESRINIKETGGAAWDLVGNADTVDGVNFLGTTDNIPLNFVVNNSKAGRLDSTNVIFGFQASNSSNAIGQSVIIGYQAGYSLNAGNTGNVAIGWRALYNSVSVTQYNVAIGWDAASNFAGQDIHAIGADALRDCTSGERNTAYGSAAGVNVYTGSLNTIIGFQGGYDPVTSANSTTTGNFNTLIGYHAFAGGNAFSSVFAVNGTGIASNEIVFGGANDNYSGITSYFTKLRVVALLNGVGSNISYEGWLGNTTAGVNIKYGGTRYEIVANSAAAESGKIVLSTRNAGASLDALTINPEGSVTFAGVVYAGTTTGTLNYDSTQKAFSHYSTLKGFVPNYFFSQTNSVVVGNTTTETSLLGTGVGTKTLPANFWTVGKMVSLKIKGSITNGSTTPTIQWKVYYGATAIGDTTSLIMTTVASSMEWEAEVFITCRSVGASGTVEVAGLITWVRTGSTSAVQGIPTTLTTIDTTGSNALDFKVTWGTAAAGNVNGSTNATLQFIF